MTDLNELATEQFDVINLDQVLEHTQQPLDALCALKRLCSDRTLVRITVPDVLRHRGKADMWEGFPFSGRMHIMSPYEHLQGFNPVSLRLLLAQAGLKEVRGWSIVLGWPLDQLRRLAGTIVPAARRTHALARFA